MFGFFNIKQVARGKEILASIRELEAELFGDANS